MCLPSTSNVHSTSTTPEPPPLHPPQYSSNSDSSSSTTAQIPLPKTTDYESDTTKDKNNLVTSSSSSNLKKPSITATYSSPYDVITIELNRKAGKGLGLSLTRKDTGDGKNPSPEILISRVIRGGVADSASPDPLAHQILHGDQIIEVNGRNLSQMSFEEAAVLLKVSNYCLFPVVTIKSMLFNRQP